MSTLIEYLPLLLDGLIVTLELLVVGAALALVVAFTAGLARLSRHALIRGPAYVFIEVFRGTSIIVQLFWVFFVLPTALGIELPPFLVGVLILSLNEGAYAAEIVRSAIKSRPVTQTEACIALGLRPFTRMRRVLIPQSIPAMLPGFGNVLIDLLKNSALCSTVTVIELTRVATIIRDNTGETTTVFLMLLVVYFVLSVLLSMGMGVLERRFAISPTARPQKRQLFTLFRGGVRV
ncbi:MAG: ectoine/hydroxyectoine ABC transporter permease subunit EhuC [Propionibacteriales bacterium]|nr:ectoine/hydroxyectoine ABC transporter permease subunit EhuC [Propionibacteriales bacterium]